MAATVDPSINLKSDGAHLSEQTPPPYDHQSAAPTAPNQTVQAAPPAGSNPYVAAAPSQSPPPKKTMEAVKGVLSKWGKKVGQAAKKTEVLSKNTWQHLKTAPNLGDAAMGRIAQGAKVIAEGGHEKIFRQTFNAPSEEQLKKAFACYLSTSAGPVMGILYISTVRIAFCSDNPLSYQVGDKTEWTYYKVVIPLGHLKGAHPSVSQVNKAEKFIQVVSIDDHEFWFLGFVNYDSAVRNLQRALNDKDEPQSQINSPPQEQPRLKPHINSPPQQQPELQPQIISPPQEQPELQPQIISPPQQPPQLQPQIISPPQQTAQSQSQINSPPQQQPQSQPQTQPQPRPELQSESEVPLHQQPTATATSITTTPHSL